VREKILDASKNNCKNAAAVAQELLPDLPYVVSCANDFLEDAEGRVRVSFLAGLGAVIGRIPPDADLEPLLELTDRAASAYDSAVRQVAARYDTDWLLERSCARGEDVRRFAAKALQPSLPLGQCSEEGLARLAERMGVEEKRRVYDELTEAILGRLRAEWVGSYAVSIDAAWRPVGGAPQPAQWASRAEPFTVACDGATWTVSFLGKTWSGATNDLEAVRLTQPASKLLRLVAFVPPWSAVRASSVTVSFREGFQIGVHPVPMHERERMLSSPLSHRGMLPQGAVVLGQSVRERGGFPGPEVQWLRPAKAGFDRFKVTLVRRPPSSGRPPAAR